MELHHTLAEVTFKYCAGQMIQLSYCPSMKIHAENCDFHHGEFLDSTYVGSMIECVLTDSYFHGSDCTELCFKKCKMRELNIQGSVGISISDNDDGEEDFEFLK